MGKSPLREMGRSEERESSGAYPAQMRITTGRVSHRESASFEQGPLSLSGTRVCRKDPPRGDGGHESEAGDGCLL